MLSTSLFLDYLVENGLEVWKGESTRMIVGMSFGYGSRSYDQEKKHLEKLLREADTAERKQRIQSLIDFTEANKDKYDKKTKEELREIFYRDGVDITYNTHDRTGKIIKSETRHYKFLYRTPGRAKKGSCIFAQDEIWDKAHEFLYMGLKLDDDDAKIVEMGAYSSLITSSIVGRIKIEPEDILILDDVEVPFRRNVISIETNDKNQCIAVHRDDYELKNTLFDGQAIIDSAIFPSWADGYVLLRHHMTKCAAFCGHIQEYYKDYCAHHGLDYETYAVPDYWGNMHLVKNVKVITTINATKFIKFGVSYQYWSEWVHKNGCLFGVVKTAHKSKLGNVQQMSYQMINTLGMDTMFAVMNPTAEYIYKLQTNDEVFLQYLERNQNFSNDFEVLIALVDHNKDFIKSEYFKDRRTNIIQAYITNMKTGKLIQNADNLVIAGNLYGMLMHSVGEDPRNDPTFQHEDDVVQCYTERFADGEYLADFRSPHNSPNGIGYLHNVLHPLIRKYFNIGQQILVVNLNGSDYQDRHNGLICWAS